MDLSGRVALVTGASQGIGRRIAFDLADAGASIVNADLRPTPTDGGDRPTVEAIADRGGEAVYVETDVTDEDSVAGLVDRARGTLGGIDVLVNNAGVFQSEGLAETDLGSWEAVLGVNLTGVFLCCKHARPALVESAAGRIVNVASKRGLVGHDDGTAYAASKGGVVALTRQLAVELGDAGVCVNAVAPGTIVTGTRPEPIPEADPRREATLLSDLGAPADVAAAVRYLASDDARFVTGSVLRVDGGWTAR